MFYLFELSITDLRVELHDGGEVDEDEDREAAKAHRGERRDSRKEPRRPSAAQQASTSNPLRAADAADDCRSERDSIPSSLGDAPAGADSSAKHPVKASKHSQLGRIKVNFTLVEFISLSALSLRNLHIYSLIFFAPPFTAPRAPPRPSPSPTSRGC